MKAGWTILPAGLQEGTLRAEPQVVIQRDGVFPLAKQLEYIIHLVLLAILQAECHYAHLQGRKLGVRKVLQFAQRHRASK